MAAADYFHKVGAGTATTLASPGYTIGATSINVASTTNYPTDTGVTITIDEVDSSGTRVDGTRNVFRGDVASATQINELVYVGGDSNRDYSAGSTTRVYIEVNEQRENRIVDGLLVSHDQDGTLKAGAVDNVNVFASGVISTTAPFSTDLNPTTQLDENTFDFVASGCVWSGDAYGSTRAASMTSGVVYINGQRVTVSAVSARTFTASRDTYIDVGTDGVVDYNEVTNNNASPALASDHIRLGIIVTGASNIANVGSVNQGEVGKVLPIASTQPYETTDSLGNPICPRNPNRGTIAISTGGSVSTVSSETDLSSAQIRFIVPTGGRNVNVHVGMDIFGSTANLAEVRLKEGTTSLKTHRQPLNGTGGWTDNLNILYSGFFTAGLHTLKLSGAVAAGGGTISCSIATMIAELV